MNKRKLISWLASLDSQMEWDLEDMDILEEQIVDTISESGFANIKFLLED